MYNPTTRLLTILDLLQSHGQLSAQQLANSLEVEERSVRRYIMMLRDMGIPIESERGRHGGYVLQPGFRLPPLMFNADEIVAVMVGMNVMDELGAFSALAVESARAKIQRVLPFELRDKAQAIRNALTAEMLPLSTHPVSSAWLLALSVATQEKQSLFMRYQASSGEVTERTISPYGVVLHGNVWFISAYCHLRQAKRIFRLDRVRELQAGTLAYHETDGINAKTDVMNALAQMPGMQEFVIVLHAPLETVAQYVPPSMAMLESDGENTVMRCYSDDPYWMARYLAQCEFRFTVRQTTALREAIRTLASHLLETI